jgi:hypothetical protein
MGKTKFPGDSERNRSRAASAVPLSGTSRGSPFLGPGQIRLPAFEIDLLPLEAVSLCCGRRGNWTPTRA